METIYDFFIDSGGIVLFCIAVAIFMSMAQNSNQMITRTHQEINDDSYLWESDFDYRPAEGIVSGDDLRERMLGDLGVDVIIDGYSVEADEYSPLTFNFNLINKSEYKVEQKLDSDGQLLAVIYTGQ